MKTITTLATIIAAALALSSCAGTKDGGRFTAVATDSWGVSIEKDRAGEVRSIFIEGKRAGLTNATWNVTTGTTPEGWPRVLIIRSETQY